MQELKVPGTAPFFHKEDIEFILTKFRAILEGKSFLSQGNYGEQFEREFASYHGVSRGVAVSNGTTALEAMLRVVGVQRFEVIVPTNTFAASAFAVMHAGGVPVFADVGRDMTLDPRSVESSITARTRAVLTVHIGGLVSSKTLELMELCGKRNLVLLEDAAHAHGSALNGRKAGSFGFAAAFSFFSTKVMTTGEGGMVLTDDEEVARRVRLWRDQAKVPHGLYQNYHEEVGFNWRMTEVQALMGLAQLHSLDKFVQYRTRVAEVYTRHLASLVADGLIHPLLLPPGAAPNYYKFVVFLSRADREEVVRRMRREFGVSLGGFVYEIPLHEQPVFAPYRRGGLPVAEDLCRRHICLPVFYGISDDQISYVANSLRRCLT